MRFLVWKWVERSVIIAAALWGEASSKTDVAKVYARCGIRSGTFQLRGCWHFKNCFRENRRCEFLRYQNSSSKRQAEASGAAERFSASWLLTFKSCFSAAWLLTFQALLLTKLTLRNSMLSKFKLQTSSWGIRSGRKSIFLIASFILIFWYNMGSNALRYVTLARLYKSYRGMLWEHTYLGQKK